MPAEIKNNIEKIETLGIIAGGGELPRLLIDACKKQGIRPYVLAFENDTDVETVVGVDHDWSRLGAGGQNIKYLRSKNIKNLVFCGSIQRPSFKSLRPDWYAIKFMMKVGGKALGDNDLLTALKTQLEKEGFVFHGVQDFMSSLVTEAGVLGTIKPNDQDWSDIRYGFSLSQAIGQLDVGQSVVVQDGLVLGVEAIEGTDELLLRIKPLKKGSESGGVLVKTCKPQQDEDMDLPTIGFQTIQNAVQAGLSGIAIHAGQSLFLNQPDAIALADKSNLFIIGIEAQDFS